MSPTAKEMADNAVGFIAALGITGLDLVGVSLPTYPETLFTQGREGLEWSGQTTVAAAVVEEQHPAMVMQQTYL